MWKNANMLKIVLKKGSISLNGVSKLKSRWQTPITPKRERFKNLLRGFRSFATVCDRPISDSGIGISRTHFVHWRNCCVFATATTTGWITFVVMGGGGDEPTPLLAGSKFFLIFADVMAVAKTEVTKRAVHLIRHCFCDGHVKPSKHNNTNLKFESGVLLVKTKHKLQHQVPTNNTLGSELRL